MKILLVSATFPPRKFGGVTAISYLLAKNLVKRGHEVTVYTTDMYDAHSKIPCIKDIRDIDGINVHYYKNLSNWLAAKRLYLPIGLISIAKDELRNFDIIHFNDFRSFQNIVITHYAKRSIVPYVLQAHGSLPRIMARQRLKWVYDVLFGYRLLRDASKVIALNVMEAEQYKAMGVPEQKITIIPNGIDLSEYTNLPPKGSFKIKHNIPEDKKIILYLGRIHRSKGIDILIKAYAYLVRKIGYRDIILVIAGPDDGYLNEVKALAKSLNVADLVMFTGFISKEDKLKALVDAEIFVTPCFHGFPITFLEACATGTPIVTTNLGDTLEWIDGKVGYITQPIFQEFAEAMYKIISNEEVRRDFSENCVRIVKSNFSIEKIGARMEELYGEVIESNKKSTAG